MNLFIVLYILVSIIVAGICSYLIGVKEGKGDKYASFGHLGMVRWFCCCGFLIGVPVLALSGLIFYSGYWLEGCGKRSVK